MKISQAFPSKYLKAADLNNRTIKVSVNKIVFEEIGQDKDKKPILYFNGAEKGLVLNKTNATAIGAVHGEQMDGWPGKEIELFSQMVPFQGQNVAAIRVRAVAEAIAAVPPRSSAPEFNDPIGI